MVLKDGGLVFRVNEFFERKFKSFRDMDVIVRDIIINFGEKGLVGEMNNVIEVILFLNFIILIFFMFIDVFILVYCLYVLF